MIWKVCRKAANGLRLGLVWVCLFIAAEWQSGSLSPRHFLSHPDRTVNVAHFFPAACFALYSFQNSSTVWAGE